MMENKPIRVLYWGMSGNIGGIESFIINVYRNLDKSKVQIDFLVAHDKEEIAFEEEIKAMGGKIYRVMYSERESFIKARTQLKKFFKEHREFRAVHIHANFPYVFPLKYAKKAGIPIRILHSHNSGGNISNESGIRKIVNCFRDWQIKKQISKYPNTFFACSDLAANYMFPEREYKWIKNGIDLQLYAYNLEKRNTIRKEWNVSENCTVLGFIGRLREQKNPFFIIDVYREYTKLNPNSKLVIAGIGELETQIKEYSKDLIQSDRVIFLGKRTDADRLYQGMDAFLLPSIYEGLPVVLVESQTSGLPSFVSDVITRQIDVTDHVHYYSLKWGSKKWAENIFRELSKYERKDCSCELYEKGFDIKSVARDLQKFYITK